MATILAHISITPGREADFERIAAGLYRETHDTETGVNRYEYWRGAVPSTYYTLLAFSDYDAFIAHQVSPHHVEAGASFKGIIAGIRLEWIDPIADSSPLPATHAGGEITDDMADLERSYRTRQAAEIADWWLALR